MTLNQLQLIFRAHIRITLITLAAMVAGALLMTALLPTTYKARSTLVVDVRTPDSILGNSGLPFTSPAYMNTQAELASSVRTVELAITNLKLLEREELKTLWEDKGAKKQPFKPWLVQWIRGNMTVIPGQESNSLNIAVSTQWPELSAELANGLAQAYINTSVAMNVEPAKVYAQFFDEQLKKARNDLIQAQARLSDFQRERNIVVASDDQIDVENARLNELSSALTQTQNDRAERQGRANSSGESGLLQDPNSNLVLNNLRTQLQQKQSLLAEASARIGVNHPEYLRLKAEVDALGNSVREEILRSNATLSAGARASGMREASIRKEIEDQRARILTLTENRDSARTLKHDVEAAQKQFELVSTRTGMSEISSRQATANAFLVSQASPPIRPDSPGFLIILLSASLFGVVLGLVISCGVEFLDRRVRSKDDLSLIDLPPLAIFSDKTTSRPLLSFVQR